MRVIAPAGARFLSQIVTSKLTPCGLAGLVAAVRSGEVPNPKLGTKARTALGSEAACRGRPRDRRHYPKSGRLLRSLSWPRSR